MAPLRAASAVKARPSTLAPGNAKKRKPGFTRRESYSRPRISVRARPGEIRDRNCAPANASLSVISAGKDDPYFFAGVQGSAGQRQLRSREAAAFHGGLDA